MIQDRLYVIQPADALGQTASTETKQRTTNDERTTRTNQHRFMQV
jgi:hypothetical protein